MAGKTTSLARRFDQQVSSLESTRQKMESLFSRNEVNRDDIEHVYAGLFLDVFTEFEALIEALFIGLLSGNLYSPTRNIVRKVRISPSAEVRNVVFGGRSYLDWLPYKNYTLKRAKLYFNSPEPFGILNSTEKSNLRFYHIIRNAFAHKSGKALREFNNLIAGLSLLPYEKRPGGFLRSRPSSISPQTQFEIAVFELRVIAGKICA